MNLTGLVTEPLRKAKSSPNGWSIEEHLTHIHEVRYHWLGEVSSSHQATVGDVLMEVDGNWVPIEDFEEIKAQLKGSGGAVRDAVAQALGMDTEEVGPYSSPIFFMQHMVWHEGYHFALILLALRLAGVEPSEDWEEENVWGIWRS